MNPGGGKKRVLVTTADERTWPENEPVLFLGEWCRKYDRRSRWQNMDFEIVPYHWDDRRKLEGDYAMLAALHEDLLVDLAATLNRIHGTSNSVRFWRILVGPWLGYFAQILYDRWSMITRAAASGVVSYCRILAYDPERFVPNDMDDFQVQFTTDEWNEAVYSQLLTEYTGIEVRRAASAKPESTEPVPGPSQFRRFRRRAGRWLGELQRFLTRDGEAFLIAPYLLASKDFMLQLRMRQVPKVWRSASPAGVAIDPSLRSWSLHDERVGGFTGVVRRMIPLHIPAAYLEGFARLRSQSSAQPWPEGPGVIFTANAYSSDDVFKCWAAAKVDSGVPLVIGQHGGNYGMARWTFTEDHQRSISDRWLSWGWTDAADPRVVDVGNIKMVGRKLDWDPAGQCLLVENIIPRYSYHMYSIPVAGQWLDYFRDQVRFVAALPDGIRGRTTVRLYNQDYGWSAAERWSVECPGVKVDDGSASIESLIQACRICVSSWNSTTLLETLAMNVPTIIFWNPEQWEHREDAVPYFDLLASAGIFHTTPESAALQIATVWDDVAGWWHEDAVQRARAEFARRFSRVDALALDELVRVLEDVVSENRASFRQR